MLKLGLVFAGGGGKGAYQIGVWKALAATGLDGYVSAVSGASVGGLNAALFLQGDYEKAEYIWENISPKQILSPHARIGTVVGNENRYGFGLFTRDGLEEIIEDALDMSVFDQSDKNCYLSCCKGREDCGRQAAYFNMREFSYEERKGLLLATSAIPVIFPKEKIRDMHLVDGGMEDNIPVEPLYRLERCNIILAVHLKQDSDFIDANRFPDVHILEIVPRDGLGGVFHGTLDFNPEHARKRIFQGYQEAMPIFSDIKKYFTDFSESEEKIKKKFMNEAILQWMNREHQRYREKTEDG